MDMFGNLDGLIPEATKIKIGRTEESAQIYTLYPLAIKEIKRLDKVVASFWQLLMGMMQGKADMKQGLTYEFLPEITELIAVSSFEPGAEVTNDSIKERSEYIENNTILPQIEAAFKVIMKLNNFEDMLKNLQTLLQKQSQSVAAMKKPISGAPHLK